MLALQPRVLPRETHAAPPPATPTILGGGSPPTPTEPHSRAPSFVQDVATPSIIPANAQTSAEKKVLSSGEVGAILACVVFVVVGALVALHFVLAKRRRVAREESSDSDSEVEREMSRARARGRERARREMRVRVRVGVGVDWRDGDGGWEAWERDRERERQRHRRRAPEPHEVRTRPRLVPVYSNVRHVRKPPAGYFRG